MVQEIVRWENEKVYHVWEVARTPENVFETILIRTYDIIDAHPDATLPQHVADVAWRIWVPSVTHL